MRPRRRQAIRIRLTNQGAIGLGAERQLSGPGNTAMLMISLGTDRERRVKRVAATLKLVDLLDLLNERPEVTILGKDNQRSVFLLPSAAESERGQLYVRTLFLPASGYRVGCPAASTHDIPAECAPAASADKVVVAESRAFVPHPEIPQFHQPSAPDFEFLHFAGLIPIR